METSPLPSSHSSSVAAGAPDAWSWTLRVLIVLSVALLIHATFQGHMFAPLVRAAATVKWAENWLRPSIVWMGFGTLLLAFRTALWMRYRPFAPARFDTAPALTVIIPAYNEGAMVASSIDSVAAARYPRERLEILVVDDGSRDDTWEHIERAARRHPNLVTTVRFPANRGKREALAAGFRRARGDVVVTIDSDSVIERDTLLAIAGPFRDPRVGAVAGKVAVYNRGEGLIPRMLHVRFVLSFDMLRAAQSTFGTVYCCPGALSAYRLSVVREVLNVWLGQRFLGAPSTYGEDRALTNFVLGRGLDVVYQRTAVVHTVVPNTYSKLCRMYLRWDRSYIREEFHFASVVWQRPLKTRIIALVDTITTNLRYPMGYFILALLTAATFSEPATLLRVLLAIGLMSAFYTLYYLHSERSWAAVYGVLYAYFSFFSLFWIFPYALLTVRARGWLTR
jgi:hyaluronan synthase